MSGGAPSTGQPHASSGCSAQPVLATRSSSATVVVASSRPSASVTAKVSRPPSGAGRPEGADPGQQLPGMRGGDRQPVHPPRLRGGAGQGVEGGGDGQVRGDPGLAGPAGAAQQQREQLGADLRDRPGVAVGLGHPGQLVELRVGLGRLIGGQFRAEGGHPVRAGLQEHIRAAPGLLPAGVRGGGVPLQQQLQRPGLQPGHRQVDRLRQQDRLDRPGQLRAGRTRARRRAPRPAPRPAPRRTSAR